jgi:hypothetical protein
MLHLSVHYIPHLYTQKIAIKSEVHNTMRRGQRLLESGLLGRGINKDRETEERSGFDVVKPASDSEDIIDQSD